MWKRIHQISLKLPKKKKKKIAVPIFDKYEHFSIKRTKLTFILHLQNPAFFFKGDEEFVVPYILFVYLYIQLIQLLCSFKKKDIWKRRKMQAVLQQQQHLKALDFTIRSIKMICARVSPTHAECEACNSVTNCLQVPTSRQDLCSSDGANMSFFSLPGFPVNLIDRPAPMKEITQIYAKPVNDL